jgi:hypothetical protein
MLFAGQRRPHIALRSTPSQDPHVLRQREGDQMRKRARARAAAQAAGAGAGRRATSESEESESEQGERQRVTRTPFHTGELLAYLAYGCAAREIHELAQMQREAQVQFWCRTSGLRPCRRPRATRPSRCNPRPRPPRPPRPPHTHLPPIRVAASKINAAPPPPRPTHTICRPLRKSMQGLAFVSFPLTSREACP